MLADHIEANLLGDIAEASVHGRSSLDTIYSLLSSHLSAVKQRHGISFQIIAEIVSLGDKRLNKRITGTIDRYIGSLKFVLAQGVKSGEVREDVDLDAAATVLFGLVQGLVNIWALSNYSFDPQQRFTSLWDVFQEAIIKR